MRKGRTFFFAGLVTAATGLFAAPHDGGSRRAALVRLRSGWRRRGGASAFAGAPCAAEDRTAPEAWSPASPGAGTEGS